MRTEAEIRRALKTERDCHEDAMKQAGDAKADRHSWQKVAKRFERKIQTLEWVLGD